MHVALIEPEIPGNTGSVGRVCVGTNTTLHLVGELGFSIDDRAVRRAGLDYWKQIDLMRHDDFATFLSAMRDHPLHFFSTHAKRRYDEVHYTPEDVLVFGGESRGFAPEIRERFADRMVYLPVLPSIRSLNLSGTVTAALFEALRQQDFASLGNARRRVGSRGHAT